MQPGTTCSIDGCQVISRRKHQPWSSHPVASHHSLFRLSTEPSVSLSLLSVTRLYTSSSVLLDDPTAPSPVLAIWRPLARPRSFHQHTAPYTQEKDTYTNNSYYMVINPPISYSKSISVITIQQKQQPPPQLLALSCLLSGITNKRNKVRISQDSGDQPPNDARVNTNSGNFQHPFQITAYRVKN